MQVGDKIIALDGKPLHAIAAHDRDPAAAKTSQLMLKCCVAPEMTFTMQPVLRRWKGQESRYRVGYQSRDPNESQHAFPARGR